MESKTVMPRKVTHQVVRSGNHYFVSEDVGDPVPVDVARFDNESSAVALSDTANDYAALPDDAAQWSAKDFACYRRFRAALAAAEQS